MDELFSNSSKSVQSTRVLYTASFFARSSLLYLQEIGQLSALKAHTSRRSGLLSYLCFLVEAGSGTLEYNGQKCMLQAGDIVFIDCRKPYAHESSEDDFWTLRWCHFNGIGMTEIYKKYLERGGQPVFRSAKSDLYAKLMMELHRMAEGQDYVRDMKINAALSQLLILLMEDAWNPEKIPNMSTKRMELQNIKQYLDDHYTEKITMDQLSAEFFINKQYLHKIFRESYGITVVNYLNQKRITQAKHLLRFTNLSMEEIAARIGMTDANYFSRTFFKIEGVRPSEFRKMW
ncbi:TPA: AraC family transcriptional regulator [Enterococcus faecium]|nr:AraC family transcriptional regulator [Enterococcus faecium]